MKTSKPEQEAISHAVGQAALDSALSTLAGLSNREAVMAAGWRGLAPRFRLYCVFEAGLDKARANDPLQTFTAPERRAVMRAMIEIARNCEIGKKCMQGGSMPDTTQPDFSQVNANKTAAAKGVRIVTVH